MIEQVNENIYIIDTLASNRPGYTSVFIVKGQRLAILDSGVSVVAENIIRDMEESGLDPKEVAYICLSHAHFDHAGGAHELLSLLRERGNRMVKVACAKKPSVYLSSAAILEKLMIFGIASVGELAGVMEPIAESDFFVLEDGAIIDLGHVTIRTINTPGHANGHVAFYVPDSDFIFVGDACGFMARDNTGHPLFFPTSFAPEYRHEVYTATIERISRMRIPRVGFAHFGVLEDPLPHLERAMETANNFRLMTSQIPEGIKSNEEVIDRLVEKFGESMSSLFPDPDNRRLTLGALVAGQLVDLARSS
jgi:glyoxylase-like metal-dependent hydrolase (beta-lactamase superfamily II)